MTDQGATSPLRAAVVGCGRMGSNQARILARMPEYELVAVCDVEPANAERTAEAAGGATVYAAFAELLACERPDLVAVCASNTAHAALTIEAAEAGVRGVYCEKPMATSLGDARRMVEVCRERGTALVINHQRRIGGDLLAARARIDAGAVGDVRLLRGQCAGDLLSDGTHLVDSLMWLTGDRPAAWAFGQVHRPEPDPAEERGTGFTASGGFRFGHPVETGATAVVQLDGGPRLELLCGDMRLDRSPYQDYEVVGSTGRLWRTGDQARPNLFIQDSEGGPWVTGIDEWTIKPVPAAEGQRGEWRPVAWEDGGVSPIEKGFRAMASLIREGGDHPMAGHVALRGFEILMAIYESARLHEKTALPLAQERFPLELMLEEDRR